MGKMQDLATASPSTETIDSLDHEELLQQISLNLRISTTKDSETPLNQNTNHVSKVLIQNYPGFNGSLADMTAALGADESLKRRLNNL